MFRRTRTHVTTPSARTRRSQKARAYLSSTKERS